MERIGLEYVKTTLSSFLLLPSERSLVRQSQEDNSRFNMLPLTQILKQMNCKVRMPKVRLVSEHALIRLSLTRDYHDNHGRHTVT